MLCLQSKVMLRIEEPSSDFVRLLVRTVVLLDPRSANSSHSTSPPAADTDASSLVAGSSTGAEDSTVLQATPTPQAAGDDSSSPVVTSQDTQSQAPQAEGQQRKASVLSPAAVDALLSPASGCEVLLQEESRWLVVSETFSPGGICR